MKHSFIIVSHLNLPCLNNEITDGWMEHRLKLFEVVTVLSLKGQSDQDFLYVLVCAADTPEPYRSRIEALMPLNGIICWTTPEQTNYPCKNRDILTREAGTELLHQYIQPDKHGMVWTTHIGTDDSLGIHYVKSMKGAFNFDHFKYHGFLSYPEGYVCYAHEQKFYAIYDLKQFFMTLREPIKTFRGVLELRHSRLHKQAPVARVITGDPMWIKVIHRDQIGKYRGFSHDWEKTNMVEKQIVGHNRVKKQFQIDIGSIT